MNMRFKDKIVMITGATSGIGKATALAFAHEGASVILIGRNIEKAEEVSRIVNEEKRGSAIAFPCDVSNIENVSDLYDRVTKFFDHIDVLFNNAGVFKTCDLENMNFDEWHECFRVNVDGAAYMTKTFIDIIPKGGSIINNASVSGMDSFTSGRKNYMYGASKAALIKFSKLCALNYAQQVRVNVICPGIIDTEIYINRDYSRFIPGIPMGYVADVNAITGVVLFLASDDARYITGAVLPVDGGMSLK